MNFRPICSMTNICMARTSLSGRINLIMGNGREVVGFCEKNVRGWLALPTLQFPPPPHDKELLEVVEL